MADLLGSQVVGRSRKCDLRLPNRRASGEHAIIWWTEGHWQIRDLGSTNGTWVDGRRIPVGETLLIRRNALVAFGDPNDAWRFVADHPPSPVVTDLDGGETSLQQGPVVGLPTADQPDVTIYWTADGWVADNDGQIFFLADGDLVEAGGRRFELGLPEQLAGTLAADVSEQDEGLTGYRFIFMQHPNSGICMDAEGRGGRLHLRPRAHHTTLLQLAQRRVSSKASDTPDADAGWVDFEGFASEIGMDRNTLNVHIYRARQELARLGICGAGSIVERRPSSRQLRFGGSSISIVDS
jgi:hypothetical protein